MVIDLFGILDNFNGYNFKYSYGGTAPPTIFTIFRGIPTLIMSNFFVFDSFFKIQTYFEMSYREVYVFICFDVMWILESMIQDQWILGFSKKSSFFGRTVSGSWYIHVSPLILVFNIFWWFFHQSKANVESVRLVKKSSKNNENQNN